QLEKGQVLEGVVKNITSYGVFIDLGGVDGLIHITDLSWSRINHPSEVLELDQKLNVVILDFDDEKTRIQLGLKQLNAHPWDALSADLKVGDKVKGKVVVLADYGAFIEVAEGVEGLIHVSEMSWSTHLRSAQDFMKIGDEVEAVVLTLDRDERKMSLGIKQLTQDPWTDITSKYPVGSTHTGIVRNFTNFGIFVELEEGIDGLVYISDLSWTKKIKHPSEFVNIGDKLEVVVLELDVDGRKLSLGHKQTTENPWDKHEAAYAVGTVHNGSITELVDKGATVDFGDDVVAFVPARHLEKEDGKKLKKGDAAEFKVIEFNKEFKRVVASHTAIFREEEAKAVKQAEAVASSSNVEKSTLGDIDALAELKAKMEKGE
ncbi:S1 RNA-binding domain-containing protein, partial [Flavobacterium croceum]